MKKKMMALCLAGLMSVSVLGGIPFESDAAENEVVVDETTSEEGVVDSLVDDNGDVLTAIVPYTEEEIRAREEAEGKIPAQFLENLSEYVPGYEGITDSVEADAAEMTPGIDNITPSTGDVKALVLVSEFTDYQYTEDFKTEFEKRVFASDSNPDYKKLENDALSTPESSNYPYDSLRGYYQRSSFGKLNFYGEFHDFTAKHNREWYEQGDPVTQDNTVLYQDAVNSWVESILAEEAHKGDGKSNLEYLDDRLKEFDSDGDFQIDACYFLCAGGNTGWGNRWWSYRGGSEIKIGSYRLSRFVQLVDSVSNAGVAGADSVDDYIQTMIHETGHSLGIDDYYSYTTGNNEGDDPKLWTDAMMFGNTSDQDGFAKMLLGWIPKDKVWVITDKQVYNPGTKQWDAYDTESYTLALGSYARTGDLALIIPKKNETEGWDWLYDQFIMVEYYKNELNDNIKPTKTDTRPVTEDGLRIFHIYGKLNGDKFIASNTQDTMIPMISDYYKEHDNDETNNNLGVFLPGEELTPNTDPASSFYSNPSNDGVMANSRVVDSGISIKNITRTEDNKMSFDTSIVDPFAEGPAIKSAELLYDEVAHDYIKVTFDRPVNYLGGKNAAVYDYDKVNNQYDPDEKWGECTVVRRMIRDNQYKRATNILYYMLDNVRIADGMIVIPEGSLISDRGVLCSELFGAISNIPKDAAQITIAPAPGTYDEVQNITISGPEGSKIYYTLDGSEPNPVSNTEATKEYKDPFKIETSTVVKALAEDDKGNSLTARVSASYNLEKVYFFGEKENEQLKTKEITLDVREAYYLFDSVGIWAAENADRTCKYKSDKPEIASVDDDGKIMALAAGTANISVWSSNTEDAPAICTVTVTEGASAKVKEEVIKAYSLEQSGDVMRQISKDLNGYKTLKEFGESDMISGIWVASIPSQYYTGQALKPEVRVYDGVKVVDPANYTVTYKNNKTVGTANATVKIKKTYKQVAPVNATFYISATNLANDLIALDMGVKYNGKLQKPKPVLLWKSTGAKQALSASNFTVTYLDESEEEVNGVLNEGTYIARITPTSKNANFEGVVDATIKVQKADFLEKIKVTIKTKKYTYSDGKAVIPELGKDYTVSAPKGSTAITDKDFEDAKLVVQCLGNTAPGKMALIIKPGEGSSYVGSKLVYLTIK